MMKKAILLFVFFLLSQPVFSNIIVIPQEIQVGCDDKFYLIGFSNNGYIAFLKFYDTGGLCGFCPNYDFIIQSLVTDTIIVDKTYDAITYNEHNEIKVKDISKIWINNQDYFDKILGKYDINQVENIKKMDEVFLNNGINFKAIIEYSIKEYKYRPIDSQELINKNFLDKATVKLIKNENQSKIVFNFTKDQFSTVTEAKLNGILKNPFEQRTAIIYIEKYINAEGTERSTFKLIGADLDVGFKFEK